MKQFGLIGYPLSHSFSKEYFAEKFAKENIVDCKYDVFPLEKIEDFVELCNDKKNLIGLNVTIPYKEKIIPFLDELDETAANIGAVNTIKFSNGKKIGYNSDAYGFEMSLKPLLKQHHTKALILGTGGASKAVEYVLRKLTQHQSVCSQILILHQIFHTMFSQKNIYYTTLYTIQKKLYSLKKEKKKVRKQKTVWKCYTCKQNEVGKFGIVNRH